eukprot:Colp12_sorted_trinity150504_noHs@20455
MKMGALDDDVPPLEDFSDVISKIKFAKESKSEFRTAAVEPNLAKAPAQPAQAKPVSQSQPTTTQASANKPAAKSSSGFGFKKGFLTSSKPTKTSNEQKKTPKVEEYVEVKSKPQAADERFRLPEVQQAMNQNIGLLQKGDWITPELLEKIAKRPHLLQLLSNPGFSQALTELQRNPQAAMQKYQNNPEFSEALKEFAGFIGEHFEQLADKEEAKKKANPDPMDLKVQELLANPEIKQLLMDPEVQHFLNSVKQNPSDTSRLQNLNPDFARKVKRLMELGFLQVQ